MICGLLGQKLGHSYSPQIHRELSHYTYLLFEKEPEELEDFLRNGDFHGINVTIPYKKSVIPFCDTLTEQAQKLGAVNTIVRLPDGSLLGHNTDYFGFRSMAEKTGVDFANKKALVLGSGGASNTVCCVLKELGAKVIVISRHGENNYDNLSMHADCAAIVNVTPVGMYPNTGNAPVDISLFPCLECVMDLIYNPAKTKLILDAEARGIPAENGLWMLVAQAKESAEHFSSCQIDNQRILQIYRKLRKQTENIILIGMPGCGKSTIGKLLAEKLEKKFADADSVLEDYAHATIPYIIHNRGEAAFRALETKTLSRLGKESGLVIATGGGCVTRAENLPLLRQNGIIIWIQRDISQLPTNGRPLSQNTDLSKMYEIRKTMYESFADITVLNNGSPEEAVQSILHEVSL